LPTWSCFTLKQTPDAWTHELDLRLHLESL
jgi:hypothetical protein